MEKLGIGEVARRAGLQTSAIRYYERIGLLAAPERINGKRRYDSTVFQRLGVIRLARQAGFTIAEVQLLLHAFPSDTPPSQRWQKLASRKIDEINASINQALEMRKLLEKTLQCHCSSLDQCADGRESPITAKC
jgi:MerR family transcriptional regulator, redox-sensitive transcriptional activator SoxR